VAVELAATENTEEEEEKEEQPNRRGPARSPGRRKDNEAEALKRKLG
jgi:hypothetical protein